MEKGGEMDGEGWVLVDGEGWGDGWRRVGISGWRIQY